MRATAMPGYRDVKDFEKPEGVDSVILDAETQEVATPSCPATREEVFVAGSQPTQLCETHGGHGPATSTGSFLSHIFGGGSSNPPPPNGANPGNTPGGATATPGQPGSAAVDPSKTPEKKKGPLQKFFGIFGDKKKKDPEKPNPD
jgi:hypothetical protein